jgi:nicotinate-nucleotide pyrophosphorylase (carboxylating)
VLIKDNHLAIIKNNLKNKNESFIKKAIQLARKKVTKQIKIEIEVENLEELRDALSANPDIIMLDNMTPAFIKEAIIFQHENLIL